MAISNGIPWPFSEGRSSRSTSTRSGRGARDARPHHAGAQHGCALDFVKRNSGCTHGVQETTGEVCVAGTSACGLSRISFTVAFHSATDRRIAEQRTQSLVHGHDQVTGLPAGITPASVKKRASYAGRGVGLALNQPISSSSRRERDKLVDSMPILGRASLMAYRTVRYATE